MKISYLRLQTTYRYKFLIEHHDIKYMGRTFLLRPLINTIHSIFFMLFFYFAHRLLLDIDSPKRPGRFIVRVLQTFLGSIYARVWKSNFTILDRFGQAARAISEKLRGSFRYTNHRWYSVLRRVLRILGRRFFDQLPVDHRWIFWECRGCVGVPQRPTILNVRCW